MRFDFDSLLRRRVEQAESRQAERDAANTLVAEPMFAVLGDMCRDVAGWIAEYARRFPSAIRVGELRVIRVQPVDPPPSDARSPRRRRVEPEQVAAEPVPTPQRVEPEPASAPPPDPHAHLRAWTYEQLQVRASLHIPHGERMAIEAELNRRIAESTANPPVGMLTAEELRAGRTLRYSMDHGAWVKAYH